MQKLNTNNNNNNKMWHSALSHSLPYMNSYDSSISTHDMMRSNTSYEYDNDMNEHNEMMYPFGNDDIDISPHSSTHDDDITIDSSSEISIENDNISQTTTYDHESDHEIDDIKRAIEITFGSTSIDKESEEQEQHEQEQQQQQHQHPRMKFLGRLGIGAQKRPSVIIPTRTSQQQQQPRAQKQAQPRTPPTSPIDHNNTDDDTSLDAMLALMGISEHMSTSTLSSSPMVSMRRSEPINIPMKSKLSVSRPIPSRRTSQRLSNTISPLDMLIRTTTQQQQQHISKRGGWDSDDDDDSTTSSDDYFDGPQFEDLSGSMLFDY